MTMKGQVKTGSTGDYSGYCVGRNEGSTTPFGDQRRTRLSRFPVAMKKPELQEGSVYAERWMRGARSLEEVDPAMALWVKARGRRRGLITLLSLLACLVLSLSLGMHW